MSDMSYEFQSEARVWINYGANEPLKLTISEVARLYGVLGATLRDYSAQTTDTLAVLGEEEEANES